MIPVSPTIKTRMIMSEKPNDGTVAMHYGDLEDVDYLNAEDYLPTLPNTVSCNSPYHPLVNVFDTLCPPLISDANYSA